MCENFEIITQHVSFALAFSKLGVVWKKRISLLLNKTPDKKVTVWCQRSRMNPYFTTSFFWNMCFESTVE